MFLSFVLEMAIPKEKDIESLHAGAGQEFKSQPGPCTTIISG